MSLKEKIISDLKIAMKEGDAFKRDVLRLVDSAIKNSEIEKKKRETGLSEEEIIEVLARAVKQRKDSMEQFEKGNRPELAEKEKLEIEIISTYLPDQLSKEEITTKVQDIISKMGPISASDFGKIMGQVMIQLKGKADGAVVKIVIEEEIAKLK